MHPCCSCTRHDLALTPAERTFQLERRSVVVHLGLGARRGVVAALFRAYEERDALTPCIVQTQLLALREVYDRRLVQGWCRVTFRTGTLPPDDFRICHACWWVVNVRAHTGVE